MCYKYWNVNYKLRASWIARSAFSRIATTSTICCLSSSTDPGMLSRLLRMALPSSTLVSISYFFCFIALGIWVKYLYVNKRNLIRNEKWVDNEMNGEGNTVPFMEETLAEEKDQAMMCQHLFQHLVESALDFRCWCLQASRSFLVYICYRRIRMSIWISYHRLFAELENQRFGYQHQQSHLQLLDC